MTSYRMFCIGFFFQNGKRCYKVQWKDTWVFEDHLFSCKQLVETFWKDQKKEVKLSGV